MKNLKVLGMAALAITVFVSPIKAEASGVRECQTGNTRKVVVFKGNCDLSSIKQQIQSIINGNNCTEQKPGTDTETGTDTDTDAGTGTEDNNNNTDSNVSSYAEQVVKLVNEERAKEGLSPLTLDTKVTKAADVRAVEIQTKFSHTRPDGTGFATVLKANNVSYKGAGENIAYGQKSPQEVVKAWMNSAGHRANIMNAKFKNIGVGYQQNSKGTNYWVQLFTY